MKHTRLRPISQKRATQLESKGKRAYSTLERGSKTLKRTPMMRTRKALRSRAPAKTEEAVKILPDGREICQNNAAGQAEYYRRTYAMWKRQGWNCALCGLRMTAFDMSFDHENGRGGGKRDDRIEVAGKPLNAAVHIWCNLKKGSRRIPYKNQVSL